MKRGKKMNERTHEHVLLGVEEEVQALARTRECGEGEFF
jgi:hypothetical protein